MAFLRGMNVGGHRITNADLADHFHDMGFEDVLTYQASGNVLLGLGGDGEASSVLEHRIADGLEARLGYRVPTFLRSREDLSHLAEVDLFAGAEPGGKLQLVMLGSVPADDLAEAVLAMATSDDKLGFDGANLFWRPAAGISESGLDVAGIERIVGPMTIRTMGTIDRILAKLSMK